MTNTVTPETARLLAAAGFPQPSPAPGQWWGDGNRLVLIWRKWPKEYYTVTELTYNQPLVQNQFLSSDFTGLVFLPTVGDILSHPLAEGYGVSRQYDTTESGLSWVCCPTEWDTPEMVSAYHETSAAEAAALVWIELNEKK